MTKAESPTPALTMAGALAMFEEQYDGSPQRRVRVVNDVKAAFCLHPALAGLPANGTAVRFILAKFDSNKRSKNIRSNIRAILGFIEARVSRAERVSKMSSDFAALIEQAKGDLNAFFQLQRFGCWCTQHKIEPADVSDKILASFMQQIERLGTVKEPRKFHGRLVRAWNRARVTIPGWPAIHLTLPALSGENRTPSLKDLPPDVAKKHRKCEQILLGQAEVGAPRAKRFNRKAKLRAKKPKKPMKPGAADSYMKYVRRALKIAAELNGVNLAEVKFEWLSSSETAENILEALREELETNGKGERALHLMACALTRVAESFFKLDDQELNEFRVLLSQIDIPEPEMTLKNVERLRAIVIEVRQDLEGVMYFPSGRA